MTRSRRLAPLERPLEVELLFLMELGEFIGRWQDELRQIEISCAGQRVVVAFLRSAHFDAAELKTKETAFADGKLCFRVSFPGGHADWTVYRLEGFDNLFFDTVNFEGHRAARQHLVRSVPSTKAGAAAAKREKEAKRLEAEEARNPLSNTTSHSVVPSSSSSNVPSNLPSLPRSDSPVGPPERKAVEKKVGGGEDGIEELTG